MSSSATPLETPEVTVALPTGEIGWIWLRHLTSLLLPGNALLFVLTGPHPWYVAPLFMAPLVLAFVLDTGPRVERRQPMDELPAWPFDALVYLLAAMQIAIVFGVARMFAHQAIFSVDMVMVFLIVGGSSGFSIITAHELIHRSKVWEQWLGRFLLCTVLYEHFYTEHLRGHHVRVGTPEDPATARFGEAYEPFFKRTVPAQFRSAWRLEARRLGDAEMSLLDRRMIRNRILHGIAVGWGMAFAAWAAFGFAAFVAFVLQAFMAVRLLEAVNYFEHWGLTRRKKRVRPVDSWDTHSWFTYYGLTGLSRHADHHAWPQRPFQQLRIWEEAPMLPAGYVGMVDMVMGKNAEFQALATEELRRRQLGPFEPVDGVVREVEPVAPAEGAAPSGARAAILKLWNALPRTGRPLVLIAGFALAVTTGAWIEAGAGAGYFGLLAVNAGIILAFAAAMFVRHAVEHRLGYPILSWVAGFALLLTIGTLL